ncbi:thioredoxin-like 3-2, chloroplastic isoform X1 [Selaginella moellendorffii]|uniref:thioredoxin-like 3-2, chloroplastic isoform X1 n=1 Tax=Selaginella moellendorffii TaxID=88036 RepID=UPI000D1CBDDB|nr:thioredoxin-like 3-2, chloroplastic isoform X1 [Selaginella moellendorffii]XP_024537588.1 thioredoxin-like 3-2, chloroplastic isoform X1 [Selaginella moellendorffii]|eukprot:XP_024537587.1 thioredoxin-like 3-2, chloroplastic isoform X1 [Selaginella moellendorffii]
MAATSFANVAGVLGAPGANPPISRSSAAVVRMNASGAAGERSVALRVSSPGREGRAELAVISGEAELDEVLQRAQEDDSIVLIEWMAAWCRKCIYLKPQLEKLALEFQHGAKFFCVDVNAVPHALIKRVGVSVCSLNCVFDLVCSSFFLFQRMPTIQLWKNKEKKAEIIGGQKAELVVEEVRQMLQTLEK